jgi:hypothetical protein
MSMLEHCTSEQIARVRLPPGTAQLEVEATVQWSPEKLTVSAKVVGRRQVPRGKIELQ